MFAVKSCDPPNIRRQSSKRFLALYETIKDQLGRLKRHLECLTEYEELYGESRVMQELLRLSYINVIRFWCRVEKECTRCSKSITAVDSNSILSHAVANRMGRALASFSTSKLDGIVECIEQNSSDISKLIPIVQERVQRGEREDASEERRLAGIARAEQSAFFRQQQEERKLETKRMVLLWSSNLETNQSCRNPTERCAELAERELRRIE